MNAASPDTVGAADTFNILPPTFEISNVLEAVQPGVKYPKS